MSSVSSLSALSTSHVTAPARGATHPVQVRAVNPDAAPASAASTPGSNPSKPTATPASPRVLPRGSLLDLSV